MKLLLSRRLSKKVRTPKDIKGIAYHASGHCVHLGNFPRLPACFHARSFLPQLQHRKQVQRELSYCFLRPGAARSRPKSTFTQQALLYKEQAHSRRFRPSAMSFSGCGEPLFVYGNLRSYMRVLRDIERRKAAQAVVFLLHHRYPRRSEGPCRAEGSWF